MIAVRLLWGQDMTIGKKSYLRVPSDNGYKYVIYETAEKGDPEYFLTDNFEEATRFSEHRLDCFRMIAGKLEYDVISYFDLVSEIDSNVKAVLDASIDFMELSEELSKTISEYTEMNQVKACWMLGIDDIECKLRLPKEDFNELMDEMERVAAFLPYDFLLQVQRLRKFRENK